MVGKTEGPAQKDAVSEENVEQVVELVHEADQKEARELLQKRGLQKDPNMCKGLVWVRLLAQNLFTPAILPIHVWICSGRE